MEAERKKGLKILGVATLGIGIFGVPIFRSGGRTHLSFFNWIVNHSVFGPPVEYIPLEAYSRELEGSIPGYPVKGHVPTFRTMEDAMTYFKTNQVAVQKMVKNGAISIVAGDSKIKQYGDLLADVRNDHEHHSIRSLVQVNDPEVREVARVLVQAADFISAAQEFVNSFTTYGSEVGDYWRTPSETLARREGDCLPGETKIICVEDGRYKIKMIGDLENYEGIQALSYNFSKQCFEPKPIIRFLRKGIRLTVKVKVRNGSHFRCTLNHQFFSYRKWWSPQIRQLTLESHLTFQREPYVRLVVAREIPSLDNLDIPDTQLWLEGIFAAEGSACKAYQYRPDKRDSKGYRVRLTNTSPDIREEITTKLAEVKVGYSVSGYNIKVRKSPLKEIFLAMGAGSTNRHFLEDRLSASKGQAAVLLDGYTRGDGCCCDGRYADYHRVRRYGTVSSRLPEQLKFLHLLLGRPLYCLLAPAYQGDGYTGRHPTWKLEENTASRFNKEILPWLSGVSISEVGEEKEEEVFDITVADNHNFVLADSFIVAHNCDDKGILLCSLLRNYMPPDQVYCAFGLWTLGGKTDGHLWVVTEGEGGEDRIIESTAHPARSLKGKYILYGMFNDKYCFSTDIGLKEFDLKVVELAEPSLRR